MLENLDIVQVILIGLGIIIVVSVFLKSSKSENKPVPPPVVPPSTNPVVIKEVKEKEDHDFICLVQKNSLSARVRSGEYYSNIKKEDN